MKKKIILFCIFVSVFIYSQENRKTKVVINPANGGKDFGVVNEEKNILAKNINLDIAKKLAEVLNKTNDFDVILTRNNDEFLELSERSFISNTQNPDFFITIDCFKDITTRNGSEIWLLNNIQNNNNENFYKFANLTILEEEYYDSIYNFDAENQKKLLDNSFVEYKKIDISKTYLEKSKFTSDNLIKYLKSKNLKINENSNYGYIIMLHYVNSPSLYALLGNINNEMDLKIMTSEEGKSNIVFSISNSLIDFRKKYFNNESKIVINKNEEITKFETDILKSKIYFNYGKFELDNYDLLLLENKVKLLKQHKDIKITIICHTDSRGNSDFNMELSNRRAEFVKNYFSQKNISSDRIKVKGMGESNLQNNCVDDVNCTEEEHKINRRVEFRID
jgi:N-acetylmuramoyl-L-alanine amidase